MGASSLRDECLLAFLLRNRCLLAARWVTPHCVTVCPHPAATPPRGGREAGLLYTSPSPRD
eukprot:1410194-Alexandrium_andersonii.AAC.1